MALDFPPLVSAPLASIARMSDLKTYPVRQASDPGSDFNPDERDPSATSYSSDNYRATVDEDPLTPRRQGASPGGWSPRNPGMLADSKSWDQSRPIYNPRGAPADAVPSLSRLEARISFEPLYMHHYASTLYACVSFLPWNLAQLRARVDLLV